MTSEHAPVPQLVTLEPATTAVVAGVIPASGLRDFFDRAFGQIAGVLAAQGVAPLEAAFGYYHGMPAETVDLEVGFVTDRPVQPDGEVHAGQLPGGRVAKVLHLGSFDELSTTWARLGGWIAEQGLTPGADFWEVYLTEPSPDMDPADLRTELFWPVVD